MKELQPFLSKTVPFRAPEEVRAATRGRTAGGWSASSSAGTPCTACRGACLACTAASTVSGSTSASRVTCSSVAPTTRQTSPMRSTLTVLARPMRWRATTSIRPLPVPPRPFFLARRAANHSTPPTKASDSTSRMSIQVMSECLCRVGDDLADPQAEVLVDDDDLATGDERAVDQQVRRRARRAVELHDLAGVQREQLLHGHAGAADLDGDLHGDVPQQVEAAALTAAGGRAGQVDLQREGGLGLAVGQQGDGDEHALVAQPVEGGDRLLEPLGGDPDPAERRGGRL